MEETWRCIEGVGDTSTSLTIGLKNGLDRLHIEPYDSIDVVRGSKT